MNRCVFDTEVHTNGCNALIEKICNEKECPFYKSDEEYKLDENGFCVEKGGIINGNSSINNG